MEYGKNILYLLTVLRLTSGLNLAPFGCSLLSRIIFMSAVSERSCETSDVMTVARPQKVKRNAITIGRIVSRYTIEAATKGFKLSRIESN